MTDSTWPVRTFTACPLMNALWLVALAKVQLDDVTLQRLSRRSEPFELEFTGCWDPIS